MENLEINRELDTIILVLNRSHPLSFQQLIEPSYFLNTFAEYRKFIYFFQKGNSLHTTFIVAQIKKDSFLVCNNNQYSPYPRIFVSNFKMCIVEMYQK